MRVAEITRQETSQRAQLISVESYDIQLDLTGGPPTPIDRYGRCRGS